MKSPFQISPEDCAALQAIHQTQSLREAAALLNCDPAALVRKVQRIALDPTLIHKVKGRWVLAERGERAVQWLEESSLRQRQILNEIPRLRFTTTMWLSEQVVIPFLPELSAELSQEFLWSIRTQPNIETELLNGLTDFALSWHAPVSPAIAHSRIAQQKWIVIAPAAWEKSLRAQSPAEKIDFLRSKPFIRHADLNPHILFPAELAIDDSRCLWLDNFISVRSAVSCQQGWSCVPELLVYSPSSRKNSFGITTVDLPTHAYGHYSLWWIRARRDLKEIHRKLARWLEKRM